MSFILLYVLLHCIQDWYIWNGYRMYCEKTNRKINYWEDQLFYDFIGLDQLLHTITLILLWGLMR